MNRCLKQKISSIALFSILCVLLSTPSIWSTEADVRDLLIAGQKLTQEAALALETKLTQDLHDVPSRTMLIGYYGKNLKAASARDTRQAHVLWLIQNQPLANVLNTADGWLGSSWEKESYALGKKAWITHVGKNPYDLKILEHAAHFLSSHDQSLAVEYLKKIQQRDEKNPKWHKKMGELHAQEIIRLKMLKGDANAIIETAAKALAQFEHAYNLSFNPSFENAQHLLLQDLAKTAFEANRDAKAQHYAETMLLNQKEGWNLGNNIHHANIILGRIALKQGEIEKAKTHLLEAGKTPGSPQLNAFGPSMSLAKELLDQGESDTVLAYFDLCAQFWKTGQDKLNTWSFSVKNSVTPNFGFHLIR